MRIAFVILLAFAAAAEAAVSGSHMVDGGSKAREASSSSQAEMTLDGIATPIGESAAPRSLTETSELIAASPAGTGGTSTDIYNSSAPWPSMKILEAIAKTFAGIFAGTNDTIAGRNGSHAAGTNKRLPSEISLPWSVVEILKRITSCIESGRKMPKISSGTMRPSSSTEASVTGCASMILRLAPCIIDFLDPSVGSGLRKPTSPCCSGVLALSTSSAAGGAACACHLFRDPLDLNLNINLMDALFSSCDGSHFTTGSFAKLCQETETLPPLIVFPVPVYNNITNTTTTVPAPVQPVNPVINTSWEVPENTTNLRNIPKNTSWNWTSGAAELAVVGGRVLLHMVPLFLLFTAFR